MRIRSKVAGLFSTAYAAALELREGGESATHSMRKQDVNFSKSPSQSAIHDTSMQLRQAEDRCRYTTAILRERIASADKAKQLWRSILQAVLADEDNRRIEQLQRSAEKARVNEENRLEQLRRAAEQARMNEENNQRITTVRLLNIDSGRLSGDEFEQYVAEIFRHLGFMVEVTGKTGDLGMDVLACKGQLRLAIQAKRYTGPVGNDAVSAVFTAKTHYRCDHCLVVTSSRFTRSAKKLAQSTGCRLIGADEIGVLIRGEIMF